MAGYIYAIAADDGLVKVGFTTNLKARLNHLRVNSARNLEPIGAVPGTQDQESILHEMLWPEVVNGEWYRRGQLTEHFLSMLPPWPVPDRTRGKRGRRKGWIWRDGHSIELGSKLSTPKEVISALGGSAAVAEIAQTTAKVVSNWPHRGFPAETFLVMSEALKAAGHEAPPSLWRQVPASEVA